MERKKLQKKKYTQSLKVITCLVYYASFRASNGEKEDAKKKECKQSFLPMLTTSFALQGLGQKRKKKTIKDKVVIKWMMKRKSHCFFT